MIGEMLLVFASCYHSVVYRKLPVIAAFCRIDCQLSLPSGDNSGKVDAREKITSHNKPPKLQTTDLVFAWNLSARFKLPG